ncbi:hypothetical protein BZG29_19775 [Janthinobacterium sp. LM6]|nr:hypothetical protein BZG29_19775 [Janthinobacterium sp. LM6]
MALAEIQCASPHVVSPAISYFVTIPFVAGAAGLAVGMVSTISRAKVAARVIARMNMDDVCTPAALEQRGQSPAMSAMAANRLLCRQHADWRTTIIL